MEELNFDTDDEYTAAPLESDSDDDDLMYGTPAATEAHSCTGKILHLGQLQRWMSLMKKVTMKGLNHGVRAGKPAL